MAKKVKGKKRGVKPSTKRGKYKRTKPLNLEQYSDIFKDTGMKIGDTLNIRLPKDYVVGPNSYTPSPILTLCGQLEDAILLLENRISNSIAKINSLM